jgi:Ca2+-binding EF-hand superfamily protein
MTLARCRQLAMLLMAVLLMAALAAGAAARARAAEPSPAARWHADVFFFCQRQLVVMRLYVRSDGRDLPVSWDRATAKFFKGCDADHNGLLAGAERRRVPTPEQLAQFGLSKPAPAQSARAKPTPIRSPAAAQPSHVNRAAAAGAAMSLEEFREYLARAGAVPFLLEGQAASALAVEASGDDQDRGARTQLFRALDADSSGRLSRRELQNAARSLHRYDLDEDGRLTREEIASVSQVAYLGRRAQRVEPQLAATVASAGSATTLARRIMQHYDRPASPPASAGKDDKDEQDGEDGKLSAEELGWTADALRPHDADGDGELDFDELARLAARPMPTVNFAVRQGAESMSTGLAKFVGGLFSGGSAASDARGKHGEWDFPATHIELRVDNASAASGFVMQQMFGIADMDKNKYLEKKEAALLNSGALFDYLDFDGDGKVFETEWVTDGGRLLALAEAQTRLQVSDLGQPLFEAIDADRDGRLDRHELDELARRVSAWDADGDAAVTPGEVPRLLRLATTNEARLFGLSFASRVETRLEMNSGADEAPPDWFRAMDRNGDGELSRLEFVGELSRFQKLDADRDGFVSSAESNSRPAAQR